MLFTKDFSESRIEELAEIVQRINPVELVTPLNVADAKEKWLQAALEEGRLENPVFFYDEEALEEVVGYRSVILEGMNHLRTTVAIESTSPVEGVVLTMALGRLNEAVRTANLAESILLKYDQRGNYVARQLYGFPTDRQKNRAYSIVYGDEPREQIEPCFTLEERQRLQEMEFNALEIKEWFELVIDMYGIPNWSVEIGEQYTAIDVRDRNLTGHSLVGVPRSRKVNGLKLLELIGHEIECHLRSSANSRALIDSILGPGGPLSILTPLIAKSTDEFLYEGVAKVSDVRINGSKALPKPYATIAIDNANLGLEFRDIAAAVNDARREMGESKEAALKGAWTTTYRIMRGSTDTSAGHYCFPKDYAYLAGYDFARRLESPYSDFSSLRYEEIEELAEYCYMNPRYPYQDVVSWAKNWLLYGDK